MALLVEDGTGVIGANSYVTFEEARMYAVDRGLSLPVAEIDLGALLIKAIDFIETMSYAFKGEKVYGEGFLQWPRTGVMIDGFTLPEDSIPVLLKQAQCQAAVDLQKVDPLQATDGFVIKREKVDVIETEYAVSASTGQVIPAMVKVNALLRPLLRSGFMLRLVRI